MSETRRYERQVKPGMQFTDGDRTISATGKDDDYLHYVIPGQSGNGSMSLELFWSNFHPVRPTTPEGWALFLPDGPLPDTGQKDFKPGQVWALAFQDVAVVFRVRDEKDPLGVPGDVLAEREWRAGGRIIVAGTHQRMAVMLFDAPEAATDASPAAVAEAIDWARSVPGEAARRIKHSNSFWVGQVYAAHTHVGAGIVFEVAHADERRVRYRLLAGKDLVGQSFDIGSTFAIEATLIRKADGTWAPGYDKNGPIAEKAAPAERQLAPGWVRLETPGMNGDRMWFCSCSGTARATYAKTDTLAGACGVCASRAGVFADRPASPAPASKPTFVEARAAITKPCPACNGQPFETRRCPRCHMPPKSEPVRVKIRAVGAYNDRGPVDRKWGSMVPDSPKRWLATQTGIATGLHLEKPRQPTARVGTVPQSLGAGIGIWAARGMR